MASDDDTRRSGHEPAVVDPTELVARLRARLAESEAAQPRGARAFIARLGERATQLRARVVLTPRRRIELLVGALACVVAVVAALLASRSEGSARPSPSPASVPPTSVAVSAAATTG